MKFFVCAFFLSAFLSLVHPRQTWAQMACNTGTPEMCNADQKCTPGGCRDLVTCQRPDDCDFCLPKDAGADANPNTDACDKDGDACLNYRCKCETDMNCGLVGRCAEDKRCVRKDDPPECGRACLINTDCSPVSDNGQPGDAGTPYNCTFDEKHPYVGLCCPSITGEPEQKFSCDVGQDLAAKSGGLAFASLIAITLMGRIRRRSAARKKRPARSRPASPQEK